MKHSLVLIIFTCLAITKSYARDADTLKAILPGAYRMNVYVPLLKGKRIGVFANQTSVVDKTNLIDTLLKQGIIITKIFSPEHGFRGNADAGAQTENYIDSATGISVVSLYGKKIKPTGEDFKDVDMLLFDIQDVGVRFYTYISSLQYFMEAAFENSKPLMILDRPNPNGFYVDGPVLDPTFKSFIGMQPVPVVYGMTIGEYAFMIAEERWLTSDAANRKYDYYRSAENSADTPFHFFVIRCANYDHKIKYQLPVKPSPNLVDMGSIYWYPSTCFFEGTNLSEGRGTDKPFQIFGAPSLPKTMFVFTPVAKPGASSPKYVNQVCYGWNVSGTGSPLADGKLHLQFIIEDYKLFPEKGNFFIKPKSNKAEDYYFNKLAGNAVLMQQVIEGKSEQEIRASWQPALNAFKQIRKKYLFYDDFE
jgi:uncharacterized protein YbbC (DUF1343 family)